MALEEKEILLNVQLCKTQTSFGNWIFTANRLELCLFVVFFERPKFDVGYYATSFF